MSEDPKAFAVRIAWAAWRYCIGSRDERFSLRDCIRWLELLEGDGGTKS